MQPPEFTNKALESAICPLSKAYLYVKDPKTLGLSAVVTKGSKRFLFRYRIGGRQRNMSLGAFPALKVADARRLALQHHRQVAYGIDPLEEKTSSKRCRGLRRFSMSNICRLSSCTNPAGMWMKACFRCIWRPYLAKKPLLKLPLTW